jgi:hypothetical protein
MSLWLPGAASATQPDPQSPNVRDWSNEQKISAAIRSAAPSLGYDAAQYIQQLLTPTSIAVMAGIAAAWATAQFFLVGEAADVVLMIVFLLGGAFTWVQGVAIAKDLYAFVHGAVNATSKAEIDTAGQAFARAFVQLGGLAITSFLLKKIPKVGAIDFQGGTLTVPELSQTNLPPIIKGKFARFDQPRIINGPLNLFASGKWSLRGATDGAGNIYIDTNVETWRTRYVLAHEQVHSWLSPKLIGLGKLDLTWLRDFRAVAKMRAYSHSALCLYLEEFVAEFHADWVVFLKSRLSPFDEGGLPRVINKLDDFARYRVPRCLSFPVKNGYVTLREMGDEAQGIFIGVVALRGLAYKAYNAYFVRDEEMRHLLQRKAAKAKAAQPRSTVMRGGGLAHLGPYPGSR